jgi:hypothetical protein
MVKLLVDQTISREVGHVNGMVVIGKTSVKKLGTVHPSKKGQLTCMVKAK